ncbi:ArsR family transcriptional regulator [Corynebacterium kutscheri]|uniref:ArsR family transcriptional regulator n=1 Tax=Corynebacterium kutscheri TaxID=35755 RepID=A0A0F6TD26_9CORY|nr:metalloregulator ArsR/SmtB family transcription factor [Corynebacterium kutscheri]AKE41269.1 putative transcriptional regulator [Corynebacterium kutscheri]VEH08545.1 ArsR family transcriptional regulator [Corynebacterium kutscheri]VEH09591.1 ArsR family transcriptional regulator [Corynebacterium kutscheri]VEH79674.1 ArsR family transcriptional regulator [Corynebacterium kutscheri]
MPDTRTTDGETRRQIMLLMLRNSPITATQLGQSLGLSATGIRRHLDNLVDNGFAERAPARKVAGTHSRGRPAKTFRLTSAGRAQFGHDYDSLAVQALQTLRETGGDEAVRAFAKKRAQSIVDGVDSLTGIEEAAEAVVEAFSHKGYAATVSTTDLGVQICQHHCPIAGVAAEFPELCEAEHEVIAALFGQHVQPLASIADGHGICTTNIPITPIKTHSPITPDERSGS